MSELGLALASGSSWYWFVLVAVFACACIGWIWSIVVHKKNTAALAARRDPSRTPEKMQSHAERIYAPVEPVKHHCDGTGTHDEVYGELLETIKSKKPMLLLKGICVIAIGVVAYKYLPLAIEVEFAENVPSLVRICLPWIPLIVFLGYGISFFLRMTHCVELYERGMIFHKNGKQVRCFYSDIIHIKLYKTHDASGTAYRRMSLIQRFLLRYWVCEIATNSIPVQVLRVPTYRYLREKAESLDRNLITPSKGMQTETIG